MYVLQVENELITLAATNASLVEVMKDLERRLGVEIKTSNTLDRPISGQYEGVSLDRLLFSLGVNYVLYYQRNRASGALSLAGAGVSDHGDASLYPGTAGGPAALGAGGTLAPEEQDAFLRYVVTHGETLEGIARLFIVKVEALEKANGLSRNTVLEVGRIILIPPSQL